MFNVYARVMGGADTHTFALTRALRERGHEVEFLATADAGNVETAGEFVTTRVTTITRDELGMVERGRVAAAALWNREAAWAAEQLIERFRPDVIHAHKLYPQLSVAPIVIAARHGVPVVQTVHDYEFISAGALDHTAGWRDRDETRVSYRVLNTATFPIRRRVHRPRVAHWISVSEYVADRHRAHGIDAQCLPNFCDPTTSPPVNGERAGAVFAARLSPEKGVGDVLELARKLPDLPVAVFGRGPLESQVRAAAAELPNLEFEGFAQRERVLERIAAARVALVPSRWQEPAPNAVLEAVSLGTPVVGYRNGGVTEMVGGTGAGLAVEPDVANLVAACSELLRDDARWRKCQRAGQEALTGRFSLPEYVERLESVFISVRR